MLALALVFGLMVGTVSAAEVDCDGRVTGGGQIREGKYKISFGISLRVVDGELVFHNTTIQFHNVSVDELDGGKFKGKELTRVSFYENRPSSVPYDNEGCYQVVRYDVTGKFNGEDGYKVIVRLEDAGEPGRKDNIRIELYAPDGLLLYDTTDKVAGGSKDFPGESNNEGTARHLLDKGNFQVCGCMCEPEPDPQPQ